MNGTALLLSLLVLANTTLELEVLRLEIPSNTGLYLADTTADGTSDLLILEGGNLEIRSLAGPFRSRFEFPPAATAFDFVAWPLRAEDAIQRAELFYMARQSVYRAVLTPNNEPPPAPEAVCESASLLGTAKPSPHPYPLLLRDQQESVIAVPGADGVVLWSLQGESRGTLPYARLSSTPSPQLHAANRPAGPGHALAWDVTGSMRVAYAAPGEAESPAEPLSRPGTESQRAASNPKQPEQWPWFVLAQGDDAPASRAYFRTETGQQPACIVRVRTASPEGGETFGPERRYPGLPLLPSEHPPDFDGDGYADLLLWRAKRPASAFTEAPRLLTDPTWPVYLQGHRYMPESARFDPEALFHIELNAHVTRFLESSATGPFEHLLLADFAGSGKTGMALATAPDNVRLYLDLSTRETGDTHADLALEDGIRSVEILGPVKPDGADVLLIRGDGESLVAYAPVSADF